MNLSHRFYYPPESKVFLLKRYRFFFFNLMDQNFSFQIWSVFGEKKKKKALGITQIF